MTGSKKSETARQTAQSVMRRDMSAFTPDLFMRWVDRTNARLSTVGFHLSFEIRSCEPHFAIREVTSGRAVFCFAGATRLPFDQGAVEMWTAEGSWAPPPKQAFRLG
jgi:hypothetical protein